MRSTPYQAKIAIHILNIFLIFLLCKYKMTWCSTILVIMIMMPQMFTFWNFAVDVQFNNSMVIEHVFLCNVEIVMLSLHSSASGICYFLHNTAFKGAEFKPLFYCIPVLQIVTKIGRVLIMLFFQFCIPCPVPVFCLLLGVSSGCAWPITGQVTSVSWPVIGRA